MKTKIQDLYKKNENLDTILFIALIWMVPIYFMLTMWHGRIGGIIVKSLMLLLFSVFLVLKIPKIIYKPTILYISFLFILGVSKFDLQIVLLATFCGLVAYSPLFLATFKIFLSNDKKNQLMIYCLLAVLAFIILALNYSIPGIRIFLPHFQPNSAGAYGVGIIVLAGFWGKRNLGSLVILMSLLIIALSLGRAAALAAALFLLGLAVLRGGSYWLLLFLSLLTAIYNFYSRGDFIAQQFGPEGRMLAIAIQNLENQNTTTFEITNILGFGFGFSTNIFYSLIEVLNIKSLIGNKILKVAGGGDNSIIPIYLNGGIPLLLICSFCLFGWLVKYFENLRHMFVGASFAFAIIVLALGQHLFELWPCIVLILIMLWSNAPDAIKLNS